MKLREVFKTGMRFKRAGEGDYRDPEFSLAQFSLNDLFADDWETEPPMSKVFSYTMKPITGREAGSVEEHRFEGWILVHEEIEKMKKYFKDKKFKVTYEVIDE